VLYLLVTNYSSDGYCFVHNDSLKSRIIFREELHIVVNGNLNTDDYTFVDGQSSIQRNGYDCGVFSLMNIEKYTAARPTNHPIVQPLMKLFRLRILGKLYRQSVRSGLGG